LYKNKNTIDFDGVPASAKRKLNDKLFLSDLRNSAKSGCR
jgi:hypothetical protein